MGLRFPHGPGVSTSPGTAAGLGAGTAAMVTVAGVLQGGSVSDAAWPAVWIGLLVFAVLYGYGRVTGKKTTGEGLPSANEYWDEQYRRADPRSHDER